MILNQTVPYVEMERVGVFRRVDHQPERPVSHEWPFIPGWKKGDGTFLLG
jgi:hypothetical protein